MEISLFVVRVTLLVVQIAFAVVSVVESTALTSAGNSLLGYRPILYPTGIFLPVRPRAPGSPAIQLLLDNARRLLEMRNPVSPVLQFRQPQLE